MIQESQRLTATDSAESRRARCGRRVLSEAVVTGRGRNPGGAGLNENTTRLVVCIPVLVSPSCCNPILRIWGSTFRSAVFKVVRLISAETQGTKQLGRAGVNRAHSASYRDTTYPSVFFPPSVPGHRVACREGLRAMSIDTLLEAARYLEWQAQQQQIARGKLQSRLVHHA